MPLSLYHPAVKMERLGQALARFRSVGLDLEHNVLDAEFRIAAHCRRDLLYFTCQGIVEEFRLVSLEIRIPEADERRDAERRRVAPDLATGGFDLSSTIGQGFRLAHV